MSKKKRKKKRKRHQTNQAKTTPKKTKKEEEISGKKPKIILISIIALLFFLTAVVLLFRFLAPEEKIKSDSNLNVLLITLDTTRADRMGYSGYHNARTPNLDSLARNGIWFTNAFSSVPITLPSHCSIFTGTIPLYHKVRNNGNYFLSGKFDTLAEILKRHKYETSAFVSSFTLDSRFGLDQGFDIYNDRLVENNAQVKTFSSERPADMVFKDFSQRFEQNFNKRFFSWVHFFDPHLPYLPPEPYKSQFQSNPYDGEIAFVDEYVGKIIDLLKTKKVYENTLIVIVGDHGEAFGEHGEFGHQIFCYEENLRVPLIFIASKGLTGNKKIIGKTDIVDIMPTILDFLNIESPKNIQGTSLIPAMKSGKARERTFYIESIFPKEALGCAEVKGVIKNNYKYIDLPESELYNLKDDPFERNNLVSQQKKIAVDLKLTMINLMKKYSHIGFDSKRKISVEEAKRLQSLGYISVSGKDKDSLELPDPKRKVKSWSEYLQGNQLQSQGKNEEAIQSYKRAIEDNPNFSWPYSRLGSMYYWNGDIENSKRFFKEGIVVNPEDYILKIDFVNFLISESEYYEAFEILKELKRLNTIDAGVQVNHLMARIFFIRKEYKKAIPYYKEILEIETDNQAIKKMLAFCLQRADEPLEALKLYLELEKSEPDAFDLKLNIALIYGNLEQYDRAKVYFEKAITKDPEPVVYFNYAAILANAGEFKEAIRMMHKFIDIYPHEDARKMDARQTIEKWKLLSK
jgi:arylsulfatase A-like enzyme/Tfp pilus assembly protein PilF